MQGEWKRESWMGRENSHKMKTRTMREKGVGATHCKRKKSKGEMAMHYNK